MFRIVCESLTPFAELLNTPFRKGKYIYGLNIYNIWYQFHFRIVCVVEKGNPQQKGPARITIGRSGRRVVESVEHFEFVDPNPTSIQPSVIFAFLSL